MTSQNQLCGDLRTLADRARKGVAACYCDEWRIYCAESEPSRWPDGRFRLLNRGYQLWRDHAVSFTRDELILAGYHSLLKLRRPVDAPDQIMPLQPDCELGRADVRSHEYREALATFLNALAAILAARGEA